MKKTIVSLAAALVFLTGCATTTDTPAPAPVQQVEESEDVIEVAEEEPEPVKTEKPAPRPKKTKEPSYELSDEAIQRLALEIAWDEMNYSDRQVMCDAMYILGPEWGAEQVASGTDNDFDPKMIEEFFIDRCDL